MDYIQLLFYMNVMNWISVFLFIGWFVIWLLLEDWDRKQEGVRK